MSRARSSHSLVLVVTLALASCAHDPPPSAAPPAPVLAVVEPVAADPPIGPEPMADGPALLSSICDPVWSVRDDGSRRIACTTHAPYVTPVPVRLQDIGEHHGDALDVCELMSITRGAFTRNGAREVFLAFAECKARGKALPTAFATVFEELDGGKYRPVAYQDDLHIEHCQRTQHPEGRQIFYCEATKRDPNLGTGVSYAVVDFAHSPRYLGVVATLTRHDFDCHRFQTSAANTMPKGYVWMRTPTFHAERGKLVIDVERAYEPPSPALNGRLGAECQSNPETDGLGVLPAPQKQSLTIEPKGDSYAPAPTAKALLDQWNRELNDYRLRIGWPTVWPPKR